MSTNLTPFEQRRLLRIALGSCIGFSLCKIMNWPYGIFFAVFPMLLLGMVPMFNRMVAGCTVAVMGLMALRADGTDGADGANPYAVPVVS